MSNQDFGEGCTTHGIKYILERDQPFPHRLLWLGIVIAGVGSPFLRLKLSFIYFPKSIEKLSSWSIHESMIGSIINILMCLYCTHHNYHYFQFINTKKVKLLNIFPSLTQIAVAAVVSENAYKSWEDNPILTTVSTTAFPIHSLEYPAITICGQGMATDTLDKVLKERFESWMRARNLDLNRKTLMI